MAIAVQALLPAGEVIQPVLLAPWARYLTSIGADDQGPVTSTAHALAPRARRAALGEMQRPPLDGPVDMRRPGRS